jgi:hypothetical protein
MPETETAFGIAMKAALEDKDWKRSNGTKYRIIVHDYTTSTTEAPPELPVQAQTAVS